LNAGYVLNAKGLLTESAEENIIASIIHLAGQNPRAAARLVAVISNPPKIGSAKLTWRDGQLNGIEVVEQTY
jgi:hypothetical protein